MDANGSNIPKEAFFTSIATLSDWLKNPTQLFQPIRSKTNSELLAAAFPRLAAATCICSSSDWFFGFSVSAVIGQIDYFGFGFKILYALI